MHKGIVQTDEFAGSATFSLAAGCFVRHNHKWLSAYHNAQTNLEIVI